jgi:hypothetical protein
MTIVSGTYLTYSAIGNREDLSDQIYNISPTDCPFMSKIGTAKASAVTHEWQTDTLATAAANTQFEGDDFTYSTPTATSRLLNTCQISYKTTIVSKTQDAVNKAGRAKEMVYQLMKRAKELRRDMEFTLTQNQARVAGASATARALRSLDAWYSTNAQRGGGGGNGGSTTAATDAGTQRVLTESLVKTGIQNAWTAGGDVDLIMCGPFNKQVISSFSGNVTRTDAASDDKVTLNSAVDIYRSDFGTHAIVANRFSRDRDLHLLTTDLWALAYLRPMNTVDIASTGDATKGAVIAEYTLESRNEAGSAIVADLTTS